jgi:hypothetical protein
MSHSPAAKPICVRCLVREQSEQWAMSRGTDLHGIWDASHTGNAAADQGT